MLLKFLQEAGEGAQGRINSAEHRTAMLSKSVSQILPEPLPCFQASSKTKKAVAETATA